MIRSSAKISVVIPTYNRATFIGRTLDSVMRQTLPVFEVVVVDDGSQDDTQQIVESHPSRARFVAQENAGPSAARNRGIRETTGELILFLDSDDILEPDAISRLDAALQTDRNAALSFGRAIYIDQNDVVLTVPNTMLDDTPEDGDMWRQLLRGNCIRTMGVVLVRRDVLEEVGGFDETLRSNEDWDLWICIAETSRPLLLVPEITLRYRVHGQNLTSNHDVMRNSGLAVYEKHLERHSNDPARLSEVRRNYDACFAQHQTTPYSIPEHAAQSDFVGLNKNLIYDNTARKKHLRLRNLIERTGIASLYRKTPMEWRLRLRALFGINPNA